MTDTQIDFDNIDPTDTEGMKRIRAAYEAQRAVAESATAQAAALTATARTNEIRGILTALNAPGPVADLYPADQPVTKEAITEFLKEKVGLSVDLLDKWGKYESTQGGDRTTVGPAEDEMVQMLNRELKRTEDFYRQTNNPTAQEIKELNELKTFVFNKHNEWDAECAQGKMGPLVDPQGFGGFLDPPPYARRARNYVSQAA